MSIPRSVKITAAFFLVFVAGLAVGSAGTVWRFKRAFEQGFKAENWKEFALSSLTRKLDLTPAQQAQVRPLLDEAGLGYKAAFGRLIDDGGRVMLEFDRKLDSHLTPEQVAKRREMSREFRAQLQRNLNLDLPAE